MSPLQSTLTPSHPHTSAHQHLTHTRRINTPVNIKPTPPTHTLHPHRQLVEGYFAKLHEKYPAGRMERADFVEIFHVAFPSRWPLAWTRTPGPRTRWTGWPSS